jgi:hypothetical protein
MELGQLNKPGRYDVLLNLIYEPNLVCHTGLMNVENALGLAYVCLRR